MKFIHVQTDISKLIILKEKSTSCGRVYYNPLKPDLKYPSITTILKDYKEKPLKAWRKRIGEEKANKISKAATERGDSFHSMMERYINNENPSTFKGKHKVTFSQARPVVDKHINNIHAQEVKLFSPSLKVAGRVDLIAEWDKKLSVIDFKGSNKRKKEEWIIDYFMQASFYALAFWEQTKLLPKQIVIIISSDDFTVIPYIRKSGEFIPQLKEQVDNWYKKYGKELNKI